MPYLMRVFENDTEAVAIPNPLTLTGALTLGNNLTLQSGKNLALTKGTLAIGAQANVAASGVAISAAAPGVLRVFSDDAGANVGDSVRGVQSRTLLTIDQSGGTIRALQGQLKLIDGIDVATGIYTASQGYVEFAATHAVSSGATLSCFDASMEIGTALTVASGGEAYGVHVETTGSGTITNNGTCAAIGITKASGAASWPVGLFVSPLAVTTAISVGTKANTAGSGVVIPSTDDFGAVRIFTDDNGGNVADSVRALQSRTLLTISQSAGTIRTVQGQLKALTGVNFDTGIYTPVQGYIELAGTHTVSAAGVLACFDASIEITTALTATGYVAGYKAELTGAGTCAAGLDCGFLVTNAAGAAVWTYGMYVEASAVDTGLYIGACTTGINIVNATLGVTDARAIKIATSQAAPNMADGYGVVEIDHTITGTAGASGVPVSALSSWVNIPTGAVVGAAKYVCAQNNGVYEDSGATITTARIIFGMRAQMILGDTDAATFPFSLNTNNAAITALFDVPNATDMGWVDGVLSNATGDGHIPIFRDNAGTVHYVNTYVA